MARPELRTVRRRGTTPLDRATESLVALGSGDASGKLVIELDAAAG